MGLRKVAESLHYRFASERIIECEEQAQTSYKDSCSGCTSSPRSLQTAIVRSYHKVRDPKFSDFRDSLQERKQQWGERPPARCAHLQRARPSAVKVSSSLLN